MPDVQIRRDRAGIFVVILGEIGHILRAQEIPGINKAGKNILSRHIPYIPAGQILPDRSDFSAGNFQIALKYFTVAHVNPCIFKYHSPLPFQSFLNNFIKSRIICQYFMFFFFDLYL